MEQEKNSIKEEVLNKINDKETKIKPKSHFVFKTVLGIIGGIIVSIFIIFLISFIAFILRQAGPMFVPQFGFRGLYIFFISLPWLLIIFSLLFIVVLEILVKKYGFAYRRPLIYSLIGILFFVFLGAIIIGQTKMHNRFQNFADQKKLPIMGPMYREYGPGRMRNFHQGRINYINTNELQMMNPRGQDLSVIISEHTKMPRELLIIGDNIAVFGPKEENRINAFGIQKIR